MLNNFHKNKIIKKGINDKKTNIFFSYHEISGRGKPDNLNGIFAGNPSTTFESLNGVIKTGAVAAGFTFTSICATALPKSFDTTTS